MEIGSLDGEDVGGDNGADFGMTRRIPILFDLKPPEICTLIQEQDLFQFPPFMDASYITIQLGLTTSRKR